MIIILLIAIFIVFAIVGFFYLRKKKCCGSASAFQQCFGEAGNQKNFHDMCCKSNNIWMTTNNINDPDPNANGFYKNCK